MICKTCGKLLDDQATVCDACGTAIGNYEAIFKFPDGTSEEEQRRHFDFAWDSQEFHRADYKKRETIELRWDENAVETMRNAPLNPFAAAIGETIREKEAAEEDKKRTEASRSIFEDDIFDLRQSDSEESKLKFSKKNEEFQELLDQEVEKIQRRQKEIDEDRNRIESSVTDTPPVATPGVLVSEEKPLSIDERIAQFIEKSDREMLEAMRQRLNVDNEKEELSTSDASDDSDTNDIFTLDDIDTEVQDIDNDVVNEDTKKFGLITATPFTESIFGTKPETVVAEPEITEPETVEPEIEAPVIETSYAAPIDVTAFAAPIFEDVAVVIEDTGAEVAAAEVAEPVEVAQVAEVAEPVEVAQVTEIAEPNEVAEVIEPTDDPTLFESGWASPFDAPAPASVILGEVPESSPSPLDEAEANEEIKPAHELPDFVYGDLPQKDILPAYVPLNEEVKTPAFFEIPIAFPFGDQEPEESKDAGATKEPEKPHEPVAPERSTTPEESVAPETEQEIVGPGFVDADSPIPKVSTAAPKIALTAAPADTPAAVFTEKETTEAPAPTTEASSADAGSDAGADSSGASVTLDKDAELDTANISAANSETEIEPETEIEAEPEFVSTKKSRWLFYALNVIAIIVVLLIVFFAFMKFVPDSGFGIIANKTWNSITEFFGAGSSEDKDAGDLETTPAPEEEIIPPTESKDILIAGQLFNNAKVEYIYFDPLAARDSTMAYKISAANSAAGIVNNLWKKTDAGNLLYDEQAVAAVIRYNSDLCKATGGESTDILKDIAPGSPEETKMVDYMVDVSKLEFKKLGIGDILTDDKYFYVWTSEEGVETIERKEQSFERKTLYQLAPDDDVLKVYDHVSI